MNKYILVAFFVLLVSQGLDAQLLAAILNIQITFFVKITSSFFAVLSNAVIIVLSVINSSAFNALKKINATASNADNAANFYSGMISNASSTSKFLGEIQIGNLKDLLSDVSYMSSAIASVAVGCIPPESQELSVQNIPYPQLPGCLSNSTTDCNSTTVACQAISFAILSDFQSKSLIFLAENIDALSWICSDNSSTPNATELQALIELWGNLSVAANAYANVSTSGPLLVNANASFSENFTTVLNLTASFVDKFVNSTDSIANCKVKPSKLKSGGLKKMYKVLLKRFIARRRRSAFNRAMGLSKRSYKSWKNLIKALFDNVGQFVISINAITTTILIPVARNNSAAMSNLTTKANTTLTDFANALDKTANCTEQTKTDIINNATAATNSSATTIANTILSDNITNCVNMTSLIADALASFALNLEACGQTADNTTHSALNASLSAFDTFLKNFSISLNATNNCYESACSGNLLLPYIFYGTKCVDDPTFTYLCGLFKYCATSKANSYTNCVTNITATVTASITSIDSLVNSFKAAFNTTVSGALSNLTSCVDAQVNQTLSALAGIQANYTACANSTVNATVV